MSRYSRQIPAAGEPYRMLSSSNAVSLISVDVEGTNATVFMKRTLLPTRQGRVLDVSRPSRLHRCVRASLERAAAFTRC